MVCRGQLHRMDESLVRARLTTCHPNVISLLTITYRTQSDIEHVAEERSTGVADFISGYNIIKKLGDGARSQVYQVVKPDTGEVYALKRVVRESHEDTRFLDQAITEFEISRNFDHPYLRVSYDLRRIRKMLKLAEVQVIMEYVDGTGLDRARPKSLTRMLDVFMRVAEALHHMHERGYLHADIKPNNILVTGDSVKVIDLGQACEIGFKKPRIQGTPDYIAPEQVNRQPLNKSTDVFNLGATLYWCLTQQTFPTVISRDGKRQELPDQSTIPSPRMLNSEIPGVVSRLVMECCEFEAYRRPQDMIEVISRLEMGVHVAARGFEDEEDYAYDKTVNQRAIEPVKTNDGNEDDPSDSDSLDDDSFEYDYSAFDEFTKGPAEEPPDPGEID